MGEQVVLVCDVCERPAAETVTFRIGSRNRVKDLCSTHLAELEAGSRAPRRGRKRAVVVPSAAPAKRRGRPPGSKNKTSANGRRRGRPPKTAASDPSGPGLAAAE